jgi:4-diphosphocytidyl-2-C-methyl-D-erythritol kinase
MITKPNVKINLGLNVLRKREDGFHDLETLFVPYFGINDTLEIVVGDDYSRTSAALFGRYGSAQSDEGIPCLVQGISEDGKLMITIARAEGVDWDPMKDLTAKAYMILAEDHDLPPVKIFLEKTSPVGAGLGGGSSDAAFALKMLDELCSLNLTEQQLAAYAARLGSDCAFFIYNRPMIGEGRGEVLSEYPVSGLDYGQEQGYQNEMQESVKTGENMAAAYEITVLTPEGIAVSTADAYRGIKPQLPEIPLKEALAKPVEEWKDCLFNDFETTVFDKHPELAAIKRSLYDSGAVYASMSGSGSALFAIYRK